LNGPTRVRIIYALHAPVQDRPDWPNVGFDFQPVMQRITATLKEECTGIDFQSSMATGVEDTRKILEADQSAPMDGYVVCQLNCWNEPVKAVVETGKPVLYADFQYAGSGGFLVYTAGFLRRNDPNFAFVASSNMDDLVRAVQCFQGKKNPAEFVDAVNRCRLEGTPAPGDLTVVPDPIAQLSVDDGLEKMKQSRILALRDTEAKAADPIMGIPLEYLSFEELNQAWEDADRDEAKAIADRWEQTADRIEGVSRETLEQSAAMYLAQKALLKSHGANAITINCLGGFYGGHIHAYPCLGFHELNNEGLVGACECDIRSTATMLAFNILSGGRPGTISDPVIDTSKRQIIYAHCVAPNRVFGSDGGENPFEILTHSEDRQGASVRSILPVGYLTTTLEIHPERREILMHQAKALENDPNDRACRTKLGAEPIGDIEKLFAEWDRWGWHRVTFYGDLKQPAYDLAEKIGWTVVEEA
jgi:hypothetical protein